MKKINQVILAFSLLIVFVGCDPHHSNEFYQINRDDIDGYELFIRKYPDSKFVPDAKERIVVATRIEEERLAQEHRLAEERRIQEEKRRQEEYLHRKYGNNSLRNGSQPYSVWYGTNSYIDDYTPHSEIRVSAPRNSDVVVLVRYNNMNGSVAGHRYVCAGNSSTIYLENGHYYQTFFYFGKGWNPNKIMKGDLTGGFIEKESYSKDGAPSYMNNEILSYSLTLQEDGNFSTSGSNIGEMF